MKDIPFEKIRELEALAKTAASRAYAPYSNFHVGAAILTSEGKTFIGCNVENASFGLTVCAERTALSSAVANSGKPDVELVVVYTPTQSVTPPCGSCRQFINEFGPNARIISFCDSSDRVDTTLSTLLPKSFGPKNFDS